MKKHIILFLLFYISGSTGLSAQQCFDPDASIWLDTWTSCETSPNPKEEYGTTHWIQYNFGEVRKLSKSWVWNTNDPTKLEQGFDQVKIDYSTDGSTWEYWGEMTFPMAAGEAVYGGFPGPNLQDIDAQYVLLTALSNHGDPGCFGLSQIKFNLLPDSIDIPEFVGECDAIEEAFVEGVSNEEALISWEFYRDEYPFLFEYRIEGSNEEWIEEFADEPEMYLEELESSTTYEYRITVECDEEELVSDLFYFTTNDGEEVCFKVDEIRLIELSQTSAAFEWEAPEDMDFFLIEYSTEEELNVQEIETEEPYVVIDNLQPFTSYVMRVGIPCFDFETYEEISWGEVFYFFTEDTNSINTPIPFNGNHQIFPNPTNGQATLWIDNKETDLLDYSVKTLNGKILYQRTSPLRLGENNIQLDLSNLPKGLYIIDGITRDKNYRIIEKLVKT